MGPIALFDKSFLQSLSVDESVWFDHFFIPNVCPLFYVETLADLEKSVSEGRTPEQEVGLISEKTPVMNGAPCANHIHMCIANLLGQPIPMTGQIALAGGHYVKSGGKSGVVFHEPPEAKAFTRWQSGEFLQVERQFARLWRDNLTSLDLSTVAEVFRALGIDGKSCKSLSEAKSLAQRLVKAHDKAFECMKLAVAFLNAPREMHRPIFERWSVGGYRPLSDYAPYAAHVLTVEIFFQIALAANLISSQRPSNRVDIAYLFYLPLCMVFISCDRIHQRSAPLFLRPEQDFVWGPDLKAELRRLDQHYAALPEETREQGIMAFAHYPMGDDSSLLVQLWDRHTPGWRRDVSKEQVVKPVKNEKLAAELKKILNSRPLTPDEIDFDRNKIDSMTIRRFARKRRGSWWQLPKHLEEIDNE